MYCPNCKQNFEGKFCPECGTELIEEPKAGASLNLGDANAISGDINVSTTNNTQNVDNSVTNIDNTVHNVDQSVTNIDNTVKNIDQRVTNIDKSIHNTTQNIDQSVHNNTQNVTHNVTNITQVAASEKDVELAAEKATQAIAASETRRAEADILKEQRHQQEIADAKRKSRRRTYIIAAVLLAIIAVAVFSINYYIRTGQSAAEMASKAAYNTLTKEGDINDVAVNTDDMPNDDPTVVIDATADVKAQLQEYYSTVNDLKGGFYVIKNDGVYGIADAQGKIIQKPKYSYIESKDARGMMRIEKDKKIGFLNINGYEIVAPQYDKVEKESNGLMKVLKGGLYGFLNASTMEEVTPCIYEHIYALECNKYKVLVNNKTGYLNTDGSVAEQPN